MRASGTIECTSSSLPASRETQRLMGEQKRPGLLTRAQERWPLEDEDCEREDDCIGPAVVFLYGRSIVVSVERDMDGVVMRQLVELTK
jgi:hypothetical protein